MGRNLFGEAHEQAERIVHALVFAVMEHAALKAFYSREADKVLDDKMYELTESQNVL